VAKEIQYIKFDVESSKILEEGLEEVERLFSKAEDRIKIVERINKNIVIPAVNELRYAGRHILWSLNAEAGYDKISHIEKAKSHCKRAIFDASEGGTLFCLANIDKFLDDYRNTTVLSDVMPSYAEDLAFVKKARMNSHSHKRDEEKEQIYDEYYEDMEKLEDILLKFSESRPQINKKMQAERWKFLFGWAGVIAAVATVTSLAMVLFS